MRNSLVLHPTETFENYKKVINFFIESGIDEEQVAIIAKMLLAHYV